ncbi:aminopeptidase P family N-terminal domain-containing protein [Desulfosporosinus burensis]
MKKVQKLMADNSLDSFIVSSEESIYYLTGATFKPL